MLTKKSKNSFRNLCLVFATVFTKAAFSIEKHKVEEPVISNETLSYVFFSGIFIVGIAVFILYKNIEKKANKRIIKTNKFRNLALKQVKRKRITHFSHF